VRRVISRPTSTISFLDLVDRGGVLLVNLPGGVIGLDNAGFLGTLLLSYLEAAIRSSQSLPPDQRPRVTCFIDECGSIPFPYQTLLAELVKMGADFTLVTQSLAQLEAIEKGLLDTTLANIDTLAVFQTSGRDARELVCELGDRRVEADHIVNLPDHTCLLKTQRDGTPLPVMRVDLMDAPRGDEEIARAIRRLNSRYAIDAEQADRLRHWRVQRVYGMDIQGFEKKMNQWRKGARRAREEEERRGGSRPSETAPAELGPEPEGSRRSAIQPPLFSTEPLTGSRLPDEMEKPRPRKHTRSRRSKRGTDQ
jgi:hypothetical protein